MSEDVITQFEMWARDEGFSLTPNNEHGPRYASDRTQAAWRAFAYGRQRSDSPPPNSPKHGAR